MSFEKFRILLWKNWTIQKRHWKSGLFELIFPVLLVIVFTWIKKEYTKDFDESSIETSPQQLLPSTGCELHIRAFDKIVFSPKGPWVEAFMESIYGGREKLELESFENSAELGSFLTPEAGRNRQESLFGIEFDDSMAVKFIQCTKFCEINSNNLHRAQRNGPKS